MKRLLLLLAFIPFIISAQERAIFTGIIVDKETNEPVEDVRITLYLGAFGEYNAMTNKFGRFEFNSFADPQDIDYGWVVQKEGYRAIRGIIRLNYGGKRPAMTWRLPKKPEKEEVTESDEGPSLLGAPANNLTFLIDISGSMAEEKRLDNLKRSLLTLLSAYRPEDKLSIITYSNQIKVLLENGSINDIDKIERIITSLTSGGKSYGSAALSQAYEVAMTNYQLKGNNKIILATDGIFGTDKKSRKVIEEIILKGSSDNIKLSIFSFGKEDEAIADKLKGWCKLGRGHYTSVESLKVAKEQIIKEAIGN